MSNQTQTDPSNLVQASALLERFRKFSTDRAELRLADFAARFSAMKAPWRKLCERRRDAERSTSPNFNIFRVLELHRREVTTHSRLIRELLDPEGSHGQGHLFLRSFFEVCWGKQDQVYRLPRFEQSVDSILCIIKCEQILAPSVEDLELGRRRLDLVIRAPEIGFLVAIENKVDAQDTGERQVHDYLKWLDQQTSYPTRGLIYLTPRGDLSPSAGGRTDYLCLSYKNDIAGWLKAALRDIPAPRVSDVTNQYLDIVSDL